MLPSLRVLLLAVSWPSARQAPRVRSSCRCPNSHVRLKSTRRSWRMSSTTPTLAKKLFAGSAGEVEITESSGQQIVHISIPRGPRETSPLGICEYISEGANISLDRADELVKLGAVYIGDKINNSRRKHRRYLEQGESGGRQEQIEALEGQMDGGAKQSMKVTAEVPLSPRAMQQYRLRRLGASEGNTSPAHTSYLRVHCNPRLFPVARSTPWHTRLVDITVDYVVVHKPPGMPTAPTIDNAIDCVVHQVEIALRDRDASSKLHAVSRLDVCTSGLVVLARNPNAASKLGKLFLDRMVTKRYLALLSPGPGVRVGKAIHCLRTKSFDGSRRPKIYADYDPELLEGTKWGGCWTEARSTILSCSPATSPAARAAAAADPAASATLSGGPDAIDNEKKLPAHLCYMELETGRTHQLRLQLAAMGTGIVGDTRYRAVVGRVHGGQPEDDRTDIFGQEPEAIALHAAQLEFEWDGRRAVYDLERPSWAAANGPKAGDGPCVEAGDEASRTTER